MKVLVIGSGLIGVTTAYFLRRRGFEVTVIDREEGAGRETSFANGALLTPSMADPWNAPGTWRVLLASLGGPSNSGLQLHLRALPALAGWGVTFLRNSKVERFERNALSNLRLALYSLEVMQSLRQETGVRYGRCARGTLRVFRDRAALNRASAAVSRLSAAGLTCRRLSTQETIQIEPALASIADRLAGAIHYGTDETGDAYRFCVALAEYAQQQGVEFRFRTEVSSLQVSSGRVIVVLGGREHLVADQYIVAAGSYSAPLLRRVGVHVPVQPVKGYSITSARPLKHNSLRIPVIDDHLHAVVVPLEGAVRVAGTVEFAGYDRTVNPDRIRKLLLLLQQVFPEECLDSSSVRSWCGLRPMSADGVPIIGPTSIPNLLVNTGHGHLGWTMAAGSAQLITDLISGDSPSVDPAPFAPERFSAAR